MRNIGKNQSSKSSDTYDESSCRCDHLVTLKCNRFNKTFLGSNRTIVGRQRAKWNHLTNYTLEQRLEWGGGGGWF